MNSTSNPVSPKVIAGVATGLGLTVVVAMITAITPEMVSGLGAWAPVAYSGIVALGSGLAGYIVRDPRRH